MKTILHVLTMASYSGAENVVCQIIRMFSQDNEIRMIYCSPDGQIRKVLEEKGIEYEPMRRLSRGELRRVVRKVKPDIIHAHDVRATLYASLVCGDAALVSHMHNNWENLRKTSLKGVLYLFSVRKASKIIWVSESAFSQFKYLSKVRDRSIILRNIIDVNDIRESANSNQSEKKYDIINVGRLTYQKNPERFVEVIEKVLRLYPKLTVGMIGNGELYENVKEQIKRKRLKKNIEMLGYVDKPLGIVKNSKVFFMTSRWEGTPMCILESLALGVPVVGTPVDGMLDLVKNGENGYLSDDDDVLAECLVRIVTDSDLQKQMSMLADQKSKENNSVPEYKSRLKSVYIEACR